MASQDDWSELHTWAQETRRRYALTAREFLRMCGAHPRRGGINMRNQTLEHYLSTIGGVRRISRKKGTLGAELRRLLREARQRELNGTLVFERMSQYVPMQYYVDSIWSDYEEELRNYGVQGMSVTFAPHSETIIVLSVDSEPYDEGELREKFGNIIASYPSSSARLTPIYQVDIRFEPQHIDPQ